MVRVDRYALRSHLRDFDVEVPELLPEAVETELRVVVDAARVLTVLGRLRDAPETAMRRLVDLTAIDWGPQTGRSARFEIVYRLHSPDRNQRMRVVVPVDAADPTVDSAVVVWPAASWLEREVFDLFGIHFRGHPDLRRILLESGFQGAPLRKDYPRQPELALPKQVER